MTKSYYKIAGFFIAIAILSTSCTSTRFESEKLKEEISKQGKVAVVTIGDNSSARIKFEKSIVDAFDAKGIDAKGGLEMLPNIKDARELPFEVLDSAFKVNEIHGALTIRLINIKKTTNYIPELEKGSTSVDYKSMNDYYDYSLDQQRVSGIEISQTYVLEANYYIDNALVWIGRSETIEPTDTDYFANDYAKKLIGQLKKDGIITK